MAVRADGHAPANHHVTSPVPDDRSAASVSRPGGTRLPFAEVILLYPVALLVSALRSGLPWAPTGEPLRYFEFAGRILHGLVPYRDAPLEYPPLALVPWILPRLVSTDAYTYAWLLAIQNAALATGIAVGLAWLARHGWAATAPQIVLATGLILLLGAVDVVVWLFDLLPALLVVLALVAAARERPGWAGVLLALGALVKVFPVVLVPVLLCWYLVEGRRRAAARLLIGSVVTIGVVMVPLVLMAGAGAFSFRDYEAARGAQLESVPASLAMLASILGGAATTLDHAFGAWQIEGSLARQLADVQALLLVAGLMMLLGLCLVRFRQDARATGGIAPTRVVAYGTACVLMGLITSKVLSPQFLVWLLPLAPLLPRPQALFAAGVSLLTSVLLGSNYVGLMQQRPTMVLLLDLRNMLLVVLLVWVVARNAPSLRSTSSVVLTAQRPGE